MATLISILPVFIETKSKYERLLNNWELAEISFISPVKSALSNKEAKSQGKQSRQSLKSLTANIWILF